MATKAELRVDVPHQLGSSPFIGTQMAPGAQMMSDGGATPRRRADVVPPAHYGRHTERRSDGFGTPVEAPPTAGLLHCYLIDADDERRIAVHKLLSGRANMVVRAYRNRADFAASADALDAGCVLMFDQGGQQEIASFIRTTQQERRFLCVMLACEQDIRTAIEAMKAGAVDCLLYPCEAEAILASVDDAQSLIRRLAEENAMLSDAQQLIERLTGREKDVLHGLLHGKSNKMIALDLEISPRTVEIYRAHLMEKLGTHSLSETLQIAFAAGFS